MKSIFLICWICSVVACVKIQKKSDLDQDQSPVLATAEVESQPPFILDEVLTLTEDTKIIADEVYLKSNARIYTHQFALFIQAKAIYIDRGVFIQTFPEGERVVPLASEAVDGGVVQILAHDIHGNLQVLMNGQNGGNGLSGWPYRAGAVYMGFFYAPELAACYPDSGKNAGMSGSFFLNVAQSDDFSITTSMKIGEGGAIGLVTDVPYSATPTPPAEGRIKDKTTCQFTPYPGRPGTPGQICLKLAEGERAKCEHY